MRLKYAVPMMLLLLLCACGAAKDTAQVPVSFRTELCGAGGCQYVLALTADYGEYVREFSLVCRSDVAGATGFTVLSPQAAEGITGTVSGTGADVSYGDTVLAVEAFESRRISPMAAPYLLTKAWSDGYITAWGRDGGWEQVDYALGYGNQQLTITTWFDGQMPVRAEISDGQAALITCEISEFTLQKKEDAEDVETYLGGGEP